MKIINCNVYENKGYFFLYFLPVGVVLTIISLQSLSVRAAASVLFGIL